MRANLTEEEKKARKAARGKSYRAKNKEKVSEYLKRYRFENKEKRAESNKIRYAENKEKILARGAARRFRDKEKIAAQNAIYRAENKEKILAASALYYAKNKEKQAVYKAKNREKVRVRENTRYAKDVAFKIKTNIKNATIKAISRAKGRKASRSIELLGCSIAHARQHLESQFLPGMTWENHSPGGWHIDHIKPCSSFDLTDPEQQKACFHYTNLQPLWATDNLSKGKKLDWQPQRQSAQP